MFDFCWGLTKINSNIIDHSVNIYEDFSTAAFKSFKKSKYLGEKTIVDNAELLRNVILLGLLDILHGNTISVSYINYLI